MRSNDLQIIKRESLHRFQKRDGAAIGGSIVGIIFWIAIIWSIVICVRRRRTVVITQKAEDKNQTQQSLQAIETPNTNTNQISGPTINFYGMPAPMPGQATQPTSVPNQQPMPMPMAAPMHVANQSAQHNPTVDQIAFQQNMSNSATVQKTEVQVTATEVTRNTPPPSGPPPSYRPI